MSDPKQNTNATSADLREFERVDFAQPVSLQIDGAIAGTGENISLQGVYFTTAQPVAVQVQIEDGSVVQGELVRAESLGDGRVGIAVRFAEPVAGLVD